MNARSRTRRASAPTTRRRAAAARAGSNGPPSASGASASRERRRARLLHEAAAKHEAAGDARRSEALYLRALALLEASVGPDDAAVAITRSNLGLLFKATGRLGEARAQYERALGILERTLGPASEEVGILLYNLAQLTRAQAAAMEQRSRRIEAMAAEVRDPAVLARAVIRPEHARFALDVRPSRIHRFGVFAREAIPAGARIIDYTGERIGRREARRRWNNDRMYLLRLDDRWRLDGSVNGSGAELVNHSCEPNCRLRVRDGAAWIESVKALRDGEELLVDYEISKESERIDCHCGAATCRGTINVGDARPVR